MASSDAFIGTVATTIPVFMLATMLELGRIQRVGPSPRRWIRRFDAIMYWGPRILGWIAIVTFAVYEIGLVHQLSLPEPERTSASGVTLVFGTSVGLLLAVVAMSAVSRIGHRKEGAVEPGN